MPKAMARVARYISLYPDRVVTYSIVDLGEATQAGQATIIRLCRELGYSGFREIKLALVEDMAAERLLLAKREASTEAVDIDKLNVAIQSSIQQTSQLMAAADLSGISRRIRAANRIIVFGEGVSKICATMVSHRLMRLGYPAFLVEDKRLAEASARSLPPDGVALAVSSSGLNEASLEFLNAARHGGASTMLITARQDSPLAKVADYMLPFHLPGALPLDGSMRHVAPFVTALEALAGNLALAAGTD
jgi:DNA-binding MurR/RpiR family transcriptional regulator